VDAQVSFPFLASLFASIFRGAEADEARAERGGSEGRFEFLGALRKHLERLVVLFPELLSFGAPHLFSGYDSGL
jgi:hypothetical protein